MIRKTTLLAAAATALLAGGLTAGTALAAPDRDCPSFSTQQEAQDYFESIGGSADNNADRLDDDGDGLACDDLPRGGSGGGQSDPSTEPTSESNTPSTNGNDDEQGSSSATDDDDSTADTSGSQVEVVPEGSADTGGL